MSDHVLFVNPERTLYARCWLHANGVDWRIERAEREHPSDTWPAPVDSGYSGSLEGLIRHFQNQGLTVIESPRSLLELEEIRLASRPAHLAALTAGSFPRDLDE